MGPIISVDEYIPERPPKNPMLRVPSPDLPPFPNQESDSNSINQDEPLPPPPPEILHHLTVKYNRICHYFSNYIENYSHLIQIKSKTHSSHLKRNSIHNFNIYLYRICVN